MASIRSARTCASGCSEPGASGAGPSLEDALALLKCAAPESYWKELDAYKPVGQLAAELTRSGRYHDLDRVFENDKWP